MCRYRVVDVIRGDIIEKFHSILLFLFWVFESIFLFFEIFRVFQICILKAFLEKRTKNDKKSYWNIPYLIKLYKILTAKKSAYNLKC